ncbi:hypothetical protein OAA57_00365 [bacterium]|jgi:hypothetical protein|nr:hypothetical protein [bacterium]MDB4350015.1 hypothetical protein [bacterium]
MGLVKRAADLAYTFRFIRMLVLDWKEWDAYKLGIIDEEGKRQRNIKLDNDEKKAAYTPFIRLCANIKRLVANIPGGSSKLGSFASALYLIKEHYGLKDTNIKAINEKLGIDSLDIVLESNSWFLLDDGTIGPGVYRIKEHKLLAKTCDEMVWAKDQIRIHENCSPVGDVFGIPIYEATHMKTNQKIFITVNEIYR